MTDVMARPVRHGVLSWSGGKDSALALWQARRQGWTIEWLLTTVTEPYARISMHGVRLELLQAQARAVGVPVREVGIPAPCPNEEYERRLGRVVEDLLGCGADAFVFGDIFLRDIRAYRERQLARVGVPAMFPLWGRDTRELADDFIAAGFKARLCTVDPRRLPAALAGSPFDQRFLDALPDGVDPCGENGEFHTFVCAGPIFTQPVPVALGEVVERDGFVFADLVPQPRPATP